MLTTRTMERIREYLDTLLAAVRPNPTHRGEYDISYKLTEVAFVLHLHQRASEADTLTAHACFKAVHSEDPDGWLLYIPDSDGHWVPNPGLVFVADLEDALQVARSLFLEAESPRQLGIAS